MDGRPCGEILSREVDAKVFDQHFAGPFLGQRVAYREVLQTAVADVLHIAIVDGRQLAVGA